MVNYMSKHEKTETGMPVSQAGLASAAITTTTTSLSVFQHSVSFPYSFIHTKFLAHSGDSPAAILHIVLQNMLIQWLPIPTLRPLWELHLRRKVDFHSLCSLVMYTTSTNTPLKTSHMSVSAYKGSGKQKVWHIQKGEVVKILVSKHATGRYLRSLNK